MQKICVLSLLFITFLPIDSGKACTTFVIKGHDRQIFGRNYDWDIGDALLIVNKRGCTKMSVSQPTDTGKKATWTAEYGSITFNQYGREMPSGGMNEAGLVVEAMALEATRYPDPDRRAYIGSSSQWRQYLLDTCATVAEVIASDNKIRISSSTSGPGIHLLVLDKTGECATIEFLNGRMMVHTGQNLPVKVLTNNTYAESLQRLKDESFIRFNVFSSINRFRTAAKRNRNCRAESTDELVTFAFGTLQAVASHRTQWRIVYDNKDMRIYFRTQHNPNIRRIKLSDFDFSRDTPVKVLDADADLSGDVTDKFSDYTYKANRDLIGRSFGKTSFLSKIPKERLDALARFPERFFCP